MIHINYIHTKPTITLTITHKAPECFHNDSFCPVRLKKSKSNAGRPSLIHQHIQSIVCKIPAIDLSQVVDTIVQKDITCTSYKSAVKNPVEILLCKSLICCGCTIRSTSSLEFTCLGCSETHKSTISSFTALSTIEQKMIKSILVTCEKCSRDVFLSSIDKTCDQQNYSTATLTDIVNQPLGAEPTALEKQVATNVVTTKMMTK